MRKIILITPLLTMVFLVGCQAKKTAPFAQLTTTTDATRATTKKALAADSQTWLFNKQLLSKQTKNGLSDNITVANIAQMTAPQSCLTSKMSDSINYLTDETAGQISRNIVIDRVQDGHVTIASESPHS